MSRLDIVLSKRALHIKNTMPYVLYILHIYGFCIYEELFLQIYSTKQALALQTHLFWNGAYHVLQKTSSYLLVTSVNPLTAMLGYSGSIQPDTSGLYSSDRKLINTDPVGVTAHVTMTVHFLHVATGLGGGDACVHVRPSPSPPRLV